MTDEPIIAYSSVVGGEIAPDERYGLVKLDGPEGELVFGLDRRRFQDLMVQCLALMPQPTPGVFGQTEVRAFGIKWWRAAKLPNGELLLEFQPSAGGVVAVHMNPLATAQLAETLQALTGAQTPQKPKGRLN
jgi:hypothetical protein